MSTTAKLAPLGRRTYSTTFIGGPDSGRTRRECWAAETTDGLWQLERLEETGTPWLLIHAPTRTPVSLHGSLRRARLAIAAGHADHALQCKLGKALIGFLTRAAP